MNLFKHKSYFLKLILFAYFITFLNANINSQNKLTDSLETQIATADTTTLLQIYKQLSFVYQKTDINKAKLYSQKLIEIAKGNEELLGKTYFELATINGTQNNIDSVYIYISKALPFFISINDSTLTSSIPNRIYSCIGNLDNKDKIEGLNKLAPRYFYNKPSISKELCLISLEFAKIENDPKLLAETYKTLGFIYNMIGNFGIALENITIANNYYIELYDSLNIAFTLNLLGQVHSMLGNKDISMTEYLKSEKYYLTLLENNPNNRTFINHISILYTNMGLLFSLDLQKYDEAEQYFNKVLNYSTEIKDTVRLNAAYANLGMVYLLKDDYDDALIFFNKALELATKIKHYYFASRITHNIGELYEQKGDINKSREYFEKALIIKKKINDMFGLTRTNRILGLSYHNQNQDKKALRYYYAAYKYAIQTDAKEEIKLLYKDFSNAYKNYGNIDSAYHYFKLYSKLNNELNNEQSSKRIEELQVKYETEKTENENILLKENAKIQKHVNYYLAIAISALVILIILLFYLLKTKSNLLTQTKNLKKLEEKRLNENIFAEKQINNLQNQKIKHKNRELSTATLQIINKNNILAEIADMVECTTSSETKEVNSKICKIVKDNLNTDKDWEQFKLHFEEVHFGFFDKLITNYPNLSHNDLKLCAYIRINLTSKEIAKMLHKTSDTINKSRYRIRKKLNLNTEINLDDFIREI